ncbi:adenylate kinase [Candidatus Caldarchaeum subterraneum]|uniref:Adenylate kinase n=1 Tax=Caldiarchaeum subterraneum TaxID=311458 RepID=E6N891_CALS0|nr:adenylate kinase [Candidatus Caldarchaeum subterraneum]BAJ51264.1 adenylate kinase [Candidatus Caldarchaeum subterraneum]
MKVIVTALPGSGKTTTVKKVVEKMPSLVVINYGDLMFEEASKLYGISHRDDMRKKLGLRDYQRLQKSAAERIAAMDNVVVDTHSVIKTPFGYYPGLPSEAVRIMNPHLIVFLDCRPEDILSRRLKDVAEGVDRKRETESVEAIEADQQMGKFFVAAAANTAACYLKVVSLRYEQKRPYEHAEAAAEEIVQAIKSLSNV